MKRLLGMVTALVIGVVGIAAGQEMGLFRSPVFVLQPGIVKPFSTGATTEINARVVTALPTSINRLTIVAIVQWLPFADNAAGG
jgi:fumarate reductase subunit D